jgi:hypothetical protein
MKYVLLFVETEQWEKDVQAMSPEDWQQAADRVNDWAARYADKITHRAYLQSPATATTVRLEGGEPIVTDGPFVEGKEVVSGYVEVDVADLDEALRMAKDWPACPLVEIRPIAP